MSEELAILVISCDKYCDAWEPFFLLLNRFWGDCPYKIYLGTNEKEFKYPGVTVIKSGKDMSWAENVRFFLEQIQEDYVLTFLEDFFIYKSINTNKIRKAFELVLEENIDVFNFIFPKKSLQYKAEKDIYYIDAKAEYCVNTSIAIRKKISFIALLKPGYSAWDFEVKNSKDVNDSGQFPGLYVTSSEDEFHILNGIWRGKWVRKSVEFCRKNGISIDTSMRPYMALNEKIWEFAKKQGKNILNTKSRHIIKRVLIKFGQSKRFVSKD